MILAGGDDIIWGITHLINCIIAENKIPDGWCLSYIINCYKGKGDVLQRGNYRALKLLDQVMKVMEHVLASIIRTRVDIDAMQFGLGKELPTQFLSSDKFMKSISANIKIFILLLLIWRKLLIVCQGKYCGGL